MALEPLVETCMDLHLAPHQIALIDEARRFARKHAPPVDAPAAKQACLDAVRDLARDEPLGGLSDPKTARAFDAVLVLTELGATWPALGVAAAAHRVGATMANAGSVRDPGREPSIFAEKVFAVGISPSVTGIVATGQGSGWRLSGAVSAVQNATIADYIIASATLSPSSDDVTLFCIDRMTPGLTVDESQSPLGLLSAPRATVRLDEAEVPSSQRLGDVGRSPAIVADAAHRMRLGIAAVALGVGRDALGRCQRVARADAARRTQGMEFSLSDVATALDAATLSTWHASTRVDAAAGRTAETAGARLLAAQAATRAVHTALEVTAGLSDAEVLTQRYVDARALEMYFGPARDDINRIAIDIFEE